MKTYRLPHTDLDASRIAYGTWQLGGDWGYEPAAQDARERAMRLLHTAVDQGINFIDLADIYTRTKSDTLVGDWLAASPGMRDRVILQQKIGIILFDERHADQPARYDFSEQHLMQTLEDSLKRLQTDHVDILLLHRPDPLVEPEEVARAFDQMHQSGKVRYFGVSNHSPMQIELLKRYVRQPLIANQLELNLLHNGLIEDGLLVNQGGIDTANGGLLEYCRLNDMIIQAWSPVARGRVFNPAADEPAHIHATAREINALASKYSVTPDAIALAWLLRHPAGIQPILGTLKPERIADAVAADGVELTRNEWYRLFEAARGKSVP